MLQSTDVEQGREKKQGKELYTIALFENDVTKFCTYACWDTNADKDYIVTLIIVPLLREET